MADPLVSVVIPGEPVAKGRPKFARLNGGGARVYTPKKTERAEGEVKFFAAQAMAGRPPLEGSLVAVVWAFRSAGMPASKVGRAEALSHARAPVARPDVDNYLKLACDAVNGVVWLDDAQVVSVTIHKRFSDRPRLELHVFRYTPDIFPA